MTEISAVEDTIVILNDDKAFAVFDKTVGSSFMQISSSTQATRKELLNRVVALLRRTASATGSPSLSLLVSRAQIDAFTKVKAELGKQQEDEVTHRDWCMEEMHQNQLSTEKEDDI